MKKIDRTISVCLSMAAKYDFYEGKNSIFPFPFKQPTTKFENTKHNFRKITYNGKAKVESNLQNKNAIALAIIASFCRFGSTNWTGKPVSKNTTSTIPLPYTAHIAKKFCRAITLAHSKKFLDKSILRTQ